MSGKSSSGHKGRTSATQNDDSLRRTRSIQITCYFTNRNHKSPEIQCDTSLQRVQRQCLILVGIKLGASVILRQPPATVETKTIWTESMRLQHVTHPSQSWIHKKFNVLETLRVISPLELVKPLLSRTIPASLTLSWRKI